MNLMKIKRLQFLIKQLIWFKDSFCNHKYSKGKRIIVNNIINLINDTLYQLKH